MRRKGKASATVKRNGKKARKSNGLQRGFFGGVEYLMNSEGNVVEIKATNGIFRIRSHPFSKGGAHHP